MISPHAEALYNRLLAQKKGPVMESSGTKMEGEEESEHGKDGGDLAPAATNHMSREVAFDESLSDMPQATKGLDSGQLAMHPGAQHPDKMATTGRPQIPDISQILLDSHHQSHPGTMGQKVNANVKASMHKK